MQPAVRAGIGVLTVFAATALVLPHSPSSAMLRTPGIAITTPTTGQTLPVTFTVAGTAQSKRKLRTVSVSLAGGLSVLATGTDSWRATVSAAGMPDGRYTVVATAVDAAGTRSSTSVPVQLTTSTTTPVTGTSPSPSASPSPTSSPSVAPSPTTSPSPSATTSPAPTSTAAADAQPAGGVNFVTQANSSFDTYTNAPTQIQKDWLNAKYSRMLAYSPYFDTRTSWYGKAWAYQDAYAIYTNSALAQERPEWVLRDASGNKLFIPFACANGTCSQYAADFGNPAFRTWWIEQARKKMSADYIGLFIDDVNMDFRVGNSSGTFTAPRDPRTGTTMTEADWRRYMAEFVEQVRAAFPDREIVHNSIWYAGGTAADADPYVARELKAADYINLERGVNDGGITPGTGKWGYQRLLSYVERRHAHGANVIFLGYSKDAAASEYNLASYLLVNDGGDTVSSLYRARPDDWWTAYDIDLGAAVGPRYSWNGLHRRDFAGGTVLTNEPGTTQKTVTLPGTYRTTGGALVTTVTLGAAKGVVLRKP